MSNNSSISALDGKAGILQAELRFLILILPSLAISVKSWSSAIYTLLFFVSCVLVVRYWPTLRQYPLSTLERVFVMLCLVLFGWYLFSEYANGWNSVKSHWPWIDFRFVMAVPLLLALRQMRNLENWLFFSLVFGCLVFGIDALRQMYWLNKWVANGAYNQLFFGPVAAAMAILILFAEPWKRFGILIQGISYLAVIAGFTALILSTARIGIVASVVVLILLPFLVSRRVKPANVAVFFLVLYAALLTVFCMNESIQRKSSAGVKEIREFVSHRNMSVEAYRAMNLRSVGMRLEMWRGAWTIGNENLLTGAGRAGYYKRLKELVSEGRLHPRMVDADLPHNSYFYHFSMRGVPGLILFLLFLTLPLYIFWRSRPFSRQVANMGIAWVIFFSIVSLTQSSVFSRGHYLSVYLGVLVILLASCRAGGQDSGTATNELEPRDVSASK